MAGGSWIRINAVEAHLDAKTVNAIIREALGKRAVSVTKKPELRQAIGQEFVRAVTPFVPRKTGALRESGRATTDGRVYWSAVRTTTSEDGEESAGYNYAASTYDAEGIRWPSGEYKKPSTPNTYPQWVKKFLEEPSRYDVFKNNIIPIIVEGFNEDG